MKALDTYSDLREIANRPGVAEGLREMDRELRKDPDFIAAMHRRLDNILHGHITKEDN